MKKCIFRGDFYKNNGGNYNVEELIDFKWVLVYSGLSYKQAKIACINLATSNPYTSFRVVCVFDIIRKVDIDD